MRRLITGLAALLVSTAVPAGAASLCDNDLSRLLRVTATRTFVYRSIRLPPPPAAASDDSVVSVSGTVVGQSVRQELCDLCSTFKTVVAGIGTSQQLADLKQALVVNRVGVQPSCFAVNPPNVAGSVRIFGTWELTWYGRTRSHRFRIVFGDEGEGGALPACNAQAGNLLNAVEIYVQAVVERPSQRGCQGVEGPH